LRILYEFTAFRVLTDVVFLVVLFFVQRYWFRGGLQIIRRASWLRLRQVLQGLWFLAVIFVTVAVLNSTFARFLPRHGISTWILAGGKLWLAVSFVGFVGIKMLKAADLLTARALAKIGPGRRERFDPARREFFRYAGYLVGGLPIVLGTYGFFGERLEYRIRNIEIPIPGLSPVLDGLRIVQLSDIHMSDFLPLRELRRAVEMAGTLAGDLIVVTGDFITAAHDPLGDCIAELSRLHAPLGVWGCNGNHEIYAKVEAKAQSLFAQYGMRLLRQESAEIAWRGAKFNLIGVDYQRERPPFGKRRPMLTSIESLVRKDIPNILLSHNPNSFRRAAELGIELSLAGHTHGGQVQVEILDHSWNPASYMTDFVAGLYRLPLGTAEKPAGPGGDAAADGLPVMAAAPGAGKFASIYVNRGLGTIGMPVRIGVPPEITVVTLRSES
jgi:predicted MPP superfamily phosphohydrolase